MDIDKALQTMIDNLPAKTGKSLAEWFDVLDKKQFEKHGQAVKFLKTEFQVTHGFANTIVGLYRKKDEGEVDLVKAQYQGREDLMPIYDQLIKVMNTFGDDVTITPKKTSVSIIRKRQFALIKPATKTRIDLGLKLKGKDTTDRLGNSGPFGSMCTHRVKIETVDQVDDELVAWLKEAYEKSV